MPEQQRVDKRLRARLLESERLGIACAPPDEDVREVLAEVDALEAENTRLRTEWRKADDGWIAANEENARLWEALTVIRDTDPVSAALDPDRARRIARETLGGDRA